HRLSNSLPAILAPCEPVDTAMVLLVNHVTRLGVDSQTVRVMSVSRIGIGEEIRRATAVERLPRGPAVTRLEYAACRAPDIQVVGPHGGKHGAPVARIDHGVVHHLPQEMRALHRPLAALAVCLEEEEALAGACEDYEHGIRIKCKGPRSLRPDVRAEDDGLED